MFPSIIKLRNTKLTFAFLSEPMLSNWLTVDKDVAFELLQVRYGICIGKPVYRSPGTIVEGTSSAIRSEARCVFEEMRGEAGERKRTNMKVLQESMRKSHDSGESHRTMAKLAHFADMYVGKTNK